MLFQSGAIPAQTAAGADAASLIGTFGISDGQGTGVAAMLITPPPGYTTVTGVVTNNVTFSVRQVRNGTVVATIGTLTLASGTNLVAQTPVVIPVTTQPALQPNDVLDVLAHQNGTGLAFGAGCVVTVNVG